MGTSFEQINKVSALCTTLFCFLETKSIVYSKTLVYNFCLIMCRLFNGGQMLLVVSLSECYCIAGETYIVAGTRDFARTWKMGESYSQSRYSTERVYDTAGRRDLQLYGGPGAPCMQHAFYIVLRVFFISLRLHFAHYKTWGQIKETIYLECLCCIFKLLLFIVFTSLSYFISQLITFCCF